jgi:predicted metal-dependent hydrolase
MLADPFQDGEIAMSRSVTFNPDELADLQTAVIRMLWTWQARKEEEHPDADKHLERYQRLYLKISDARWDK